MFSCSSPWSGGDLKDHVIDKCTSVTRPIAYFAPQSFSNRHTHGCSEEKCVAPAARRIGEGSRCGNEAFPVDGYLEILSVDLDSNRMERTCQIDTDFGFCVLCVETIGVKPDALEW